jgi:hypothetical protein
LEGGDGGNSSGASPPIPARRTPASMRLSRMLTERIEGAVSDKTRDGLVTTAAAVLSIGGTVATTGCGGSRA